MARSVNLGSRLFYGISKYDFSTGTESPAPPFFAFALSIAPFHVTSLFPCFTRFSSPSFPAFKLIFTLRPLCSLHLLLPRSDFNVFTLLFSEFVTCSSFSRTQLYGSSSCALAARGPFSSCARSFASTLFHPFLFELLSRPFAFICRTFALIREILFTLIGFLRGPRAEA